MSNRILPFLVFSEGFIVLTLQILVFVVLTPYWGQTFTFWVMSLVMSMLGLSLGYILTPWFIERKGGDALLFLRKLTFNLLIYLCVIYSLNKGILEFLLGAIESPVTGAAFSLFLFFLIPTVMLGMIPIAFIQYLKKQSNSSEGELSGNVFSVSSIGGIAGVLLVAHLLLPQIGATAVIIFVLMVVLVLYLFVLKIAEAKNLKLVSIAVVGFASIVLLSQNNMKEGAGVNGIEIVETSEGVLGELSVVKNNNLKEKYLMVNNNVQSVVHFSGRSLNPYVYSLAIYASYLEKNSNILIAGLGCGSLPYELGELGFEVDVVDIDDRLHGLVHEHFLVSKNEYNFIHSDVRRYVHNSNKRYESVILDISHGENVPVNVYTVEGIEDCAKLLDDDGVLYIHFLSSQDENGVYTMGSLLKTIEKAGLKYEIMDFLNRKKLFDFDEWKGRAEGFIIAASKKDLQLHSKEFVIDPSLMKELVPVKDSLYLKYNFNGIGEVFTDDKTSLEYYHNSIANKFRKVSMKMLQSRIGDGQ